MQKHKGYKESIATKDVNEVAQHQLYRDIVE
jgi:hypothetical protein